MSKTLKFKTHLVPLILSGAKQNTWRLFDDKDLTSGDIVDFINSDTGKKFATAKLTEVVQKSFSQLTEHDWSGHEKYQSDAEMYRAYTDMYKQPVDSTTLLKVIWFELIP